MKNYTMEKTIFSVDRPDDIHEMKMFYRLLDDCQATGVLTGPVVPFIGCVDGKFKPSWMMNKVDFDSKIRNRSFVQHQKSFLHVPGDARQPCVLEYKGGRCIGLGPMKQIDPVRYHGDYAMRLDDNSFWGC